MAGSSNVRAGGAFVEILTKDNALRKGLDNAAKTLQKWGDGINALGKTFLKIGTAAIAPLVATSKVFAEMGDVLAKASTRTGVTVEKLSELKYAAEQSGTDFESLEGGLRKMSKTIVEAAKGSDTATESLRLLGLNVSNLAKMKPDEQFRTIAQAMSHVTNPTLKAALAMEIFGKGGTALLPMMDEGAAGLDELGRQAKVLGLIWSTKDAKAAEEFGDRLDDLWKVIKKLTSDVGAALVPILRQVAVAITSNVVEVSKWIQAHREVVALALKLTAGLVAAGAAIVIFGTSVRTIGSVVGVASRALGVFGGVIGIAGKLLSTVMFSGLGLVIAGLGGFAAYLLYTSQTGQQAIGALTGYFGGLKDTALATFQGIKDALAADDWKLAAEILWAGIKVAFAEGIMPLRAAWTSFTKFFADTGIAAWYGVQAAWEDVRNLLTDSWTKMVAYLGGLFDALATTIANALDKIDSSGIPDLLGVERTYREVKPGEHEKDDTEKRQEREKADVEAAIAREKTKNAALEAEARRHRDVTARIGALANADSAAVDADTKAKAIAAAEDLARKKQDLADKNRRASVEKANAPRIKLTADLIQQMTDRTDRVKLTADLIKEAMGGAPKAPVFDPDAAAKGLNDVINKISAGGTFNAAAIFGLGGQDVQQQQLETQKKIEQNTRTGIVRAYQFT